MVDLPHDDALMRRLNDFIEHGGGITVEDLTAAAYLPQVLVFLGMKAGSLARFRGRRVNGTTSALCHQAQAYRRAEQVTQAVADCMDTVMDWVRANRHG